MSSLTPLPEVRDSAAAADPAVHSPERTTLEAAFRKYEPEMAAMTEAELLRLNIDLATGMSIIGASIDRIMPYRAQALAIMPGLDVSCFDTLVDKARAARWAHVLYNIASEPLESIDALIADTAEIRARLLKDADVLAARGLVDSIYQANLKGANGFRNIAQDTVLLSGVFRANWSRIQGKTAVTLEEIERAEALGEQLSIEGERRELHAQQRAAAAVMRQKAWTLVARPYEEVRRVVSFIRWHQDDLEKIAPSLYGNRASRKKAAPEEPTDDTPPVDPVPAGPPPVVIPVTPARAAGGVGMSATGTDDDPYAT